MEKKENAVSAVAPTDVEVTAEDEGGAEHHTNDGEGGRTPNRPQREEGEPAPVDEKTVDEKTVVAPSTDELILRLVDEVGQLREEIAELRSEKAEVKPSVEPLWTRDDVKDYLQCSPRFVDSLIADNKLKGVLIGSLRRFDRKTVEAFVRDGNPRLRRVQSKKKKAA